MAKGKKNEGQGEGEKKDDNGGNLSILLKVDLHCNGCTHRIRKQCLSFPGVLGVECGEDKVKVIAKTCVDPLKLKEKMEKKTLKKFELISPQPQKKDDKKPKDNKNNNKNEKPKEVPVTTVMLKVAYHCDGCGDRLHKAISAYQGVHEVAIEKDKDRVKVTGRVEGKKLVEDLSKKLKRKLEIAPPEKKEKEKEKEKEKGKEKEKKESGEGGEKKEGKKMEYAVNGSGYVGICDGSGRVVEIFEPPQFFSDDNPNGCYVM